MANDDIKYYNFIDNYLYLYHTKTLVILPQYPEHVQDHMQVNFQSETPLSRSAPIYSFSNSGPRSVQVSFQFHRELMSQINTGTYDTDYMDYVIRQIQSAAVPAYSLSDKMVDPPVVAMRLGNSIFIKGVITGGVGLTYDPPILADGKYAICDISFSISEIDPYSASIVSQVGSYRGNDLNITLERNVWTGSGLIKS